MRVLNLYAGLGGNRKLWGGVDVTAVEMDDRIAGVYRELYPDDKVVVGDAHEYLLHNHEGYDLIWSSPPCQTHSRMAKGTRHKLRRYSDMSLYQEILYLQHFCKVDFVVENVIPYYTPLIPPAKILGRHCFWSSFPISNHQPPAQPLDFINLGTVAGSEKLKEWLGIRYEGNIYYKDNHCPAQVLRNCVHPLLGLGVMGDFRRYRLRGMPDVILV